MSDVQMPATQVGKRIVVEHPNGIMQICGLVTEGQPDVYLTKDMLGWDYDVNLVASRPRYWLYRPVRTPDNVVAFNPLQQ